LYDIERLHLAGLISLVIPMDVFNRLQDQWLRHTFWWKQDQFLIF